MRVHLYGIHWQDIISRARKALITRRDDLQRGRGPGERRKRWREYKWLVPISPKKNHMPPLSYFMLECYSAYATYTSESAFIQLDFHLSPCLRARTMLLVYSTSRIEFGRNQHLFFVCLIVFIIC